MGSIPVRRARYVLNDLQADLTFVPSCDHYNVTCWVRSRYGVMVMSILTKSVHVLMAMSNNGNHVLSLTNPTRLSYIMYDNSVRKFSKCLAKGSFIAGQNVWQDFTWPDISI